MGRLVGVGRRVVPASVKSKIRSAIAQSPAVMADFATHARCVDIVHRPPLTVVVFQISTESVQLLSGAFEQASRIPIADDSSGPEWYAGHMAPDIYQALNANHAYLECESMRNAVTAFMENERDSISAAAVSPYRVVNVRAWETKPEATRFGPTEFHYDNFEPGHMKVMVYLGGLGPGVGSIELEGFPSPEGPGGIAVAFLNSDILHRAIPATDGSRRPVVEITLQRLLVEPRTTDPLIGSPNDRHLSDPFLAYA